jgi:glycosyltransferase involved in cell wall biosynthesis
MRLLQPVMFASLEETGGCLGLVKFLLPLSQDVRTLPTALAAIDTICHLEALAHEVVVVDDASRDGTVEEARRFAHFLPLWLIQHREPRGRAMAFRTAVEAACRDMGDADLLMPIDPARCPDPQTAIRAIRAARGGWDAVFATARRQMEDGLRALETVPISVYRARLVRRHLGGFLESPPADDTDAMRQLDRFLLLSGVPIHRLLPPSPEVAFGSPNPDGSTSAVPLTARAQ